jgi:hypothetical protein
MRTEYEFFAYFSRTMAFGIRDSAFGGEPARGPVQKVTRPVVRGVDPGDAISGAVAFVRSTLDDARQELRGGK